MAALGSPSVVFGANQVILGAGPVLTENRKIATVVGGLILVALALALLTIRYWRETRPVPAPEVAHVPEHARAGAAPRGSRRSVAGADHSTADEDWEPRGAGEHERIEVPAPARPSRPGATARRAALGGDTPE